MLFTPMNVEVSFPLRSDTERNPYFNSYFLER